LNYGDVGVNFGKLANLADVSLVSLCRRDSPKWLPAVTNVNDGATATCDVGRYASNAWGLFDMHGNAAEWTSSEDDGLKIARGGSFYDRPQRARSAFRISYPSWQRVHNVGFRVVCEADNAKLTASR
jgi:formylglycine-generating enzyme required for sulfatase activity